MCCGNKCLGLFIGSFSYIYCLATLNWSILFTSRIVYFISDKFGFFCNTQMRPDSMNIGKSSQLGKHGFGSLHNLTWTCISMRTSYFDANFVSQMKLTKFPLIHCFAHWSETKKGPPIWVGYQAILCLILDRIISRIKGFYYIYQSSVNTQNCILSDGKENSIQFKWPGRYCLLLWILVQNMLSFFKFYPINTNYKT